MTGKGDVLPDLDPCYLALGDTIEERRSRYREYVKSVIPAGEWKFIQEAVTRGQLTGNARYIEAVERILGRRIEHRWPGRPKKQKDEKK